MRAARHPDAGTSIPPTRRELAARAVIARAIAENRKIGLAASTWAPVEQTCPPDCPLLRSGKCYTRSGRVRIHEQRIAAVATAAKLSPRELAQAEADAIDRLPRSPLPLRLHVAGDSRTITAARLVARAAERYTRRGGGVAWTYTHAWRTVPREAWGSVSILASCDTPADAAQADAAGWAVALVVPQLDGAAGRVIPGTDLVGVGCRYDLDRTTCSDCRLCLDAEGLRRERRAILFPLIKPGGNGRRLVRS